MRKRNPSFSLLISNRLPQNTNGNLLNSDTLTNPFDAANRLVETERNSTTIQPIYNGVGDRVGQTLDGQTTNYALDVIGLPEVIYTSEGNAYLHLPGTIVAESSSGEIRYLLSDGLGSVRQAVDETGAIVAYNEFDPYGNPIDNNDGQPYGYTGEWYESDIGLLHLRARWYAPETGTFLSVDPVESEPPYQYVRGNPINLADPSGYQAGVGAVTLGGGAAVVCVATAPACAAAISAGAIIVGGTATLIIIYVTVDYLIQHPELGEVSYPAGPQPTQAPAPPLVGTPPPPPFVSADGTKPISAVPGRDPAPNSSPTPIRIPTVCTDDDDETRHKVLTVGDGNFAYSNSLSGRNPNWKIIATNYGDGSNNQTYVGGTVTGNLEQYTNVDATKLESGQVTGNDRYDAIIFNNPAVTTPNNRVDGARTAQLISSFRRSAYRVLAPGGEIHINVTQTLLRNHPDIYPRLGLPNNEDSTLKNQPRFGQSRYYAPYVPHYTTGKPIRYYRSDSTRIRFLLNFVYR